jgi:N-acetylneuraminic acid mutarotase
VRIVSRGLVAAAVALVAGGGTLIALAAGGGGDGGRPDAARSDRWTPLSPATLKRTEVAAARIGRHIYVVGGFEERTGGTSAGVERYDVRADRWTQVAPMPYGVNHPTAAAYRGRLYVHGGYRARRELASATGRLLEYDPGQDRWRRLPSAPTPRAAHALAVVGDRLYAAGGSNSTGSLRTLEVYDVRRRRWRRGPSFPGPARNHTAGVASGGRFYVIAGRDPGNFRSVDRYNPRTRSWARMPPVRTARGGIAAVRLSDGRIVLFGGEELGAGGTTIRPVELFDPRTRRWSSLPGMRTPRHGLGGAALGRRVYSIEGGPTPGFDFSDAIEYLDVRPR